MLPAMDLVKDKKLRGYKEIKVQLSMRFEPMTSMSELNSTAEPQTLSFDVN